jgi:predicted N-acyltransferase
LVAAAPLYIKGHSQGEFVFDHQWADLSYRLRIEYYPKLLGMAPFTPAVGYRFLVHPDLSDNANELSKIYDLMLAEIDRICDRYQMSGRVLSLEELTAALYVGSDALDLDALSDG